MKKLLLTVSTVSLLFAANVQSAHAEGIGDWFKGMFSSEESIESDAETHDETDVGHEVMEDHHGDNEENYTPYEEGSEDDEKEAQGPEDTTGEDAEEDGDATESAPIEDTDPHRI